MTVGQAERKVPAERPAHGRGPGAAAGADTRDNNFDALRFLMAVLVIWSHSFPFTLGNGDAYEPLHRLTGGRTTFGGIAVDVFFVISGFLVTMSWERSASAWSYLKKRVRRIYPGYIAATLVCACVVAPLFVTAGMPWMNGEYALRLLQALPQLKEYRIEGVFAGNPYPGSMYGIVWTIKYEFLCYLLVMALGLMGMLRRRWAILGLFAVVLAVYTLQHPKAGDHGWVTLWWPNAVERILGEIDSWPQLLTFYLSGMVFYLYRDRIPTRDGLAAGSAAALAGGLVLPPLLPVALATGGAYLVFYLAFQKHVAAPHFARYGDFSYGLYLYGFPVQQMIVATFGAMSPVLLFVLATPVTIGLAALSWHGVEKWFLQNKTHWREVASSSPASVAAAPT